MKQVEKIIGSSLLSLLLLLGLVFSMQTTIPVVQPLTVAANDLAGHLPLKGEVNGNGVYGYTTDYVCYDGAKETQHAVQNGWHITLKNTYFSHNVTWVECWDSDDGDYYGWIDLNFVTIYSTNNPSSGSSPVTITSISPRKGQVAGNGVYGYASSYACYSDGAEATQHKVENTWHITAKNTCYSHGVTWYECWDNDDGDYYGWIDANYLSFYDTTPAPAQTQAPKQTVIVEKTVLVTEPPKETVIVEKTILVTESPTEPSTETTDLTTATTEPVTTTVITTTTTLPDPYEMGDVDGDSMVSVDDAVQILTYYARRAAGYTTFFSEIAHINDLATNAADINGDGVISVEDAVAVLTYYAKTASGMQPSWADVIGTSSKQANTESGEPVESPLPEEFASGVSGKSGNQSGSGISQLSATISNRTSHTLGIVSRELNLVDRGIDLSALSDAETKSVFVFVCAECGFLWNRIVRIMWVYDMRGD